MSEAASYASLAPSNFPSTQPAFTMMIDIGIPLLVGSVSRGTPCTVVPITGGNIRSEPGFNIELDASFAGVGNDYVHNDADGKHMRLDAHAVMRADDDLIYLKYSGIIEITPGLSAILGGSAEARSTEFGHSFINIQFETGASKLKPLETGVFVGAGRFIVDMERFTLRAEYKISKVVGGRRFRSTGVQADMT